MGTANENFIQKIQIWFEKLRLKKLTLSWFDRKKRFQQLTYVIAVKKRKFCIWELNKIMKNWF